MNKNYYDDGHGGGYGKPRRQDNESLVKGKVDKILNLDENTVEEFIKTAEDCAQKFKQEKVNTNQIRNFYDYVKNIKTDKNKFDKVELYLLKPKIAYAVGRKTVSVRFQKTMEELINEIKTKPEFDNFVKFFEAIVAYYK